MKWKDTVGNYEVSDTGLVRHKKTKHILTPYIHGKTLYPSVNIRQNGKYKTYNVHRLVAIAFIPNPDNLPCVNHKDENRRNNNVENLEWCTHQYNVTYGEGGKVRNTKVIQKALDGSIVKVWNSQKEAAESLGMNYQEISRACRGERATSHKFIWEYAGKHRMWGKTLKGDLTNGRHSTRERFGVLQG